MSKKKKIIIAIIVALILIGAAVTLFFVLKKDKDKKGGDTPKPVAKQQITIVFDADGGEKVDDIKVAKGTSFQLPETSKEGYTFAGWYNGSKLYTDDDTAEIESNIVLTAKWEKKEEEQKTLKVVFDSKGGSKVKDMTFTCGKDGSVTLNSLPKPKKDAYNFLSWEDKHGKSILNGAKLTCDSAELKLYASWEYDGPTANPEQDPNASKTPKCPSGYTLNSDASKCINEVTAKTKCGERGFEYNGKCVTITDSVKKETQKACPKEHVTYKSFSDYVEGKVVNWGQIGCAYYKTYDTTKADCESHGFRWVTPENACYVKWIGNNTINTCNHLSNYVYITNPNSYEGVNGLNGGCFPLSEKTPYCEDSSYTLNGSKCVKTADVKYE